MGSEMCIRDSPAAEPAPPAPAPGEGEKPAADEETKEQPAATRGDSSSA